MNKPVLDTSEATVAAAAAPRTMRAIVQDAYSVDPETALRLGEAPVPAIGPGDVLLHVVAASVDQGTWHVMAGRPYPVRLAGYGLRAPRALNPGRSAAGVVETVGSRVTSLNPGHEVYGTCTASFAEYAVAKPSRLARKPANLSFEQAAAVPISGQTALQAVRDHARVQPGQTVLVIGASGGVGTFAVQIAKAFGAEVTAVASTAKIDLVRGLGADNVIDHTVDDFADGRHRYDAILDTGGNNSLTRLRRALAPDGTLVIVGGETDGRWLGGTDRQLRAQLVSLFVHQKLGTFIASENTADLDALRELIEAHKVRAVIDRIYSLSDVPAAIRYLREGRTKGKLVIAVQASPTA